MTKTHLTQYLCLDCQRTFKLPGSGKGARVCANCGGESIRMSYHFRPPKQHDTQGWKMVMLLVQNGFYFDKISVPDPDNEGAVYHPEYPRTLAEARHFVSKYKAHALPLIKSEQRRDKRRR